MRGLYAIVDIQALERRALAPIDFAAAILTARPAALQLRDKQRGSRAMLGLLRELTTRAQRAGVPLFANDRPDLALLAGCAGVHLGQQDLPPTKARTLAHMLGREFLVGLSVHDHEELARAIEEKPDYLAFGAVFATESKERAAPVLGLHGLEALVARARQQSEKPIVAIGGITMENAAEVAKHCDAIAVIGALLPPADAPDPHAWVSQRASLLHHEAGGC